jgi:hypothetical protein
MLLRRLLIGFLLYSGVASACAQQDQRYAVLPQSQAKTLIGTQLFGLPGKVTGAWKPKEEDITAIEASLSQISDLSRKSYPPDRQIEYPAGYFRQYLGLLEGSGRLIYVSAFCGVNSDQPFRGWRSSLIDVSDGGKCAWQALYDVSAKRFVAVSVNGYA